MINFMNRPDKDTSGDGGAYQLRNLPWKKFLIGAAAALGALLLLFVIYFWYLIATTPDIDTITVSPTESATYICDQEGNYLRKLTLASSNRDIVSLENIPDSLQKATISIEDRRFYQHGGIDLQGIARAFLSGITRGSFDQGASTITQQLIKNNVFTEWTQENSFLDRLSRKVQEQRLALQLEDRMTKDEILENYLNTINLGAGCYGVQAASRRYFGKDVEELTLSESAVLAAIPQNPSGYNPISYPEANRKRQLTILNYMEEQGYITGEEKEAAVSDNVYERILARDASSQEETVYSYYEDALIDQVMEFLEGQGYSSEQAYRAVYSGGLRIFSAQDPQLQQICDEEFSNPANFPEGTEFGIDYALSVADETGLVTHYGSESLRSFVRENYDSTFDLLCISEETAKMYGDAFREAILGSGKQGEEDGSGKLTLLGERLTLSPQPQASLVLMDQSTGFIRALVGGRGEKQASLTLNRASHTTRQPGSTFKILTAYAPALDAAQQTLITRYDNEPYRYEDGTPVSNWDITDYTGPTTIREAITRSVNVVAVKCITEITPQLGFDYARRLGISTLHETYESGGNISSDVIQPLALGGITQGVTNLELCGAYAAIANGGVYRTPKFFTKILDRHGDVIIDYSEEQAAASEPASAHVPSAISDGASISPPSDYGRDGAQILQDSTAFLLTSAMEDVISSPSGTAYGSIQAGGQPVAGKTGTTSSYKDIWFTGYTPYYTCSVWGGYDNNRSLPGGSIFHSYQKVLWSAVMNRVHAGLPAAQFTQPESVVSVKLCRESLLPAAEGGCPDTYVEYFTSGTEPETPCPLHQPLPETEPMEIYPDILEQLLPDTEPPTESEPESGESESSGSPGVAGAPGTSGTPGVAGSPGTSGMPGVAETPGTSGMPGVDGTPGASETPGASGAPGDAGTPEASEPQQDSETNPGTENLLPPGQTSSLTAPSPTEAASYPGESEAGNLYSGQNEAGNLYTDQNAPVGSTPDLNDSDSTPWQSDTNSLQDLIDRLGGKGAF